MVIVVLEKKLLVFEVRNVISYVIFFLVFMWLIGMVFGIVLIIFFGYFVWRVLVLNWLVVIV